MDSSILEALKARIDSTMQKNESTIQNVIDSTMQKNETTVQNVQDGSFDVSNPHEA